MRNTKLSLRMLLEEEEEDETLDLSTDDSPAGDDGDVPEDADDEAADDAGDTETQEEEVEVSPDEEASLKKPLEAQVDAVLGDFELAAIKSAQVNENLNIQMLLTEEVVEFDIDTFASNVARLIDNYDTLLDLESAIYFRALNIIQKNYADYVDAFKQIMHDRHRFDFGDVRDDPIKDSAPLALGSGGEGAGGA